MNLEQRRAAFAALVSAYSNDFANLKEGATKHCAAFVSKAVLTEAGRQALKLDPRLTSTDTGAVAVSIAKQVLTHERASKAFIDVEISEGAFLVTFDHSLHPDAATGLMSGIGKCAVLAKVNDKIGEGLVSDILLLAVEPTRQVRESAIADVKRSLVEGAEGTHAVVGWHEGRPTSVTPNMTRGEAQEWLKKNGKDDTHSIWTKDKAALIRKHIGDGTAEHYTNRTPPFHLMKNESILDEAGLHHEVTKSLTAAGGDGNKLFASPGEGWSAIHGALAKHGLVLHPSPDDHGGAGPHMQSHQLARPSALAGHEPEPIPGAYLAVHRTPGVGDREGTDGADMPMKGRHEFVTYLTGKKLKESTVTVTNESDPYAAFGDKGHSTLDAAAQMAGVHAAKHGGPTHVVKKGETFHVGAGKAAGPVHAFSFAGETHTGESAQKEHDEHFKKNESLESTLRALPKSDLIAIHAFVHEGKVDEFAAEGNRSTVSFHSMVKDGDVKNLHAALGGTEAFSKLVSGSSHDLIKGNHKFSAYGPDHKEKAEKFAQLVKANIGVEPSIEHKSLRLGESTVSDKLKGLLRSMAMPGQRAVKEGNKFDAALAAALKVSKAQWRPATYGMVAESDEAFAAIVDDVCEALVSEVPADDMKRRFIEEGVAVTGETLNESVAESVDVFAGHLQSIVRATLLGNGFGAPAVNKALEAWAESQA